MTLVALNPENGKSESFVLDDEMTYNKLAQIRKLSWMKSGDNMWMGFSEKGKEKYVEDGNEAAHSAGTISIDGDSVVYVDFLGIKHFVEFDDETERTMFNRCLF